MSRARLFLFVCTGFFVTASAQTLSAKDAGNFAQQLSDAFTSVFEKVAPTVVVIQAEHKVTEEERADLDNFDSLFREPGEKEKEKRFKMPEPMKCSEASGFFFRADGYILTNNHAVEGADKLDVRLQDGRHFPAKITGRDDKTDIAVIKIEGKDFPVAEIVDSEAVKVGQMVCAIGVPYNLDYSFTCGWVSAKGRSNLTSTFYEDYIQTDAFINPGNSGGPLLDLSGHVIGMNTLINGIARGLSFAIPANLLKDIGDQLIAKGKITRSWLGLSIDNVDADYLQNHPALHNVDHGAVVRRIHADTPAFKSDLHPEDIITQVDGVRINNSRDLPREIVKKKIGQQVELTVVREGKTVKVPVTTAELPADPRMAFNNPPKEKAPRKEKISKPLYLHGLKLQDLDEAATVKYELKATKGALVSEVAPSTPASKAEIEAGDVITEVDHKAVDKVAACEELIGNHDSQKNILLFIDRKGRKTFTVLKLEK